VIIRRISVRDFCPLNELDLELHPEVQFIIGYNGVGKTFLLRLISGLTGTDATTALVADMPIGRVDLTVEDDGKTKTFSITDRLDPEAIDKFKKTLSVRSSFPVTSWDNSFVSECDPSATDAKRLEHIFRAIWGQGLRDNLRFKNTSERIELAVGDGFRRAMRLILLDSPDGVPMLLDTPESHLSYTGKRAMIEHLMRPERQLIVVTHSIEFMGFNRPNSNVFELGQKAALDA
jgi:ATPase subunit of ABC transporter with duplicated ATPase domains